MSEYEVDTLQYLIYLIIHYIYYILHYTIKYPEWGINQCHRKHDFLLFGQLMIYQKAFEIFLIVL